jgi:phenylpropionate dioxygenase-like ring-hydroxylating dioxygenase large terminal subunit
MANAIDTPPDGPNEAVVDKLLSQLMSGLPQGEIPAGIFGNPQVYERELRRIFGRCWVFMGHESEIPKSHDFVLRKIGEDSFIVVRDSRNEIQVLLNACRHRGVQVCRADAGNTAAFFCPYHGWTYNTAGELIGAPLWPKALGDMSRKENGMLHAAQVASYRGLIFATLDPQAPPLEDYLGGMKWYLDLIFGLNEFGVEVLAPPQRIILDANWKSSAENFCGDDYHLGTLHRAAFEVGSFPVPFEENMNGFHIQAHPGHSLSLSVASSPDEPGPQFYGYPEDVARSFSAGSISEEQFALARRARVAVGTVFPNFSILVSPHTEDPAHPPTAMLSIRVWQPYGPDKIETWNWFCAYRNMTDVQKKRLYKAALGSFSVAGLFEIDDTEPWGTVRQTGRSVAAELLDMQLNYQMGLPGIGIARQVEDWPGPGVVFSPRYDEGVQRNLYQFYGAMMQAPPGVWPAATKG